MLHEEKQKWRLNSERQIQPFVINFSNTEITQTFKSPTGLKLMQKLDIPCPEYKTKQ